MSAVDTIRDLLRGPPGGGEDAIRVWVEDASHVPPGFVAHRQGGLHYFDIPLDEEIITKAEAPDDYWDMAPVDTSKAWVPYRGPMGGEGYINTDTGDVRYADKIPEDQEPQGAMSDSERRALNAVDDESPEEVAEAVEDLVGDGLGMDAEELLEDASYGRGPTPEKVARRAVQRLMGRVEHSTRRSYDEDTTEAMTRLMTGLQEMGVEDTDEKAWVPYTGPRGGEGWQHPRTGRVEYQSRPPGNVVDPDGVDNEALSADIDRQLSDRGMVVRPDGDVLEIEEEKVVGTDLAGETVMGEVKDIETAEDGEVYLVVLDEDGFSHHVRPDEATRASDLPDEKLETEGGPRSGPGGPSRVGLKAWMPYEGPEGGSGWQNSETGDVVYQEDPPGSVVDPDSVSDEVYEEFADRYDTTPDRVREVFEGAAEEHSDPLSLTPDERDRVTDVLGTPEEDQEWEDRMREDPGADPVETAVEVAAGAEDGGPPAEEQYPEVSRELLDVAEDLVARGECEDMEGVNDGFCRFVAEEAYERSGMPDDVEVLENGNRSNHHFIEYDGQYYDAEEPGGVSDWRDLPFFERTATPEWEPDVVTPEGGQSEKAWVPYEGPQGGSGWRDTDSGEVVYQDEPPGSMADPDDIPDEVYERFADDHGVSVDQVRRVFEDAFEDHGPGPSVGDRVQAVKPGGQVIDGELATIGSNWVQIKDDNGDIHEVRDSALRETTTGGRDVDPPEEIADMDVDWSEVQEEEYIYGSDPYVVLSADQSRALRDELRERHGQQAVTEVENLRDEWKTTSYSDPAVTREKAFVRATDAEGEPRNDTLSGEDPSPEMVEAAEDIAAASQHFMERHYADENGNVEVHRGLGSRAGESLKTGLFSQYAEGDVGDSVEMEFNPMTNYSVARDVAASWGEKTATVTEQLPAEDTVSATDLITTGGGEGEVSMRGGEHEIPNDGVMVDDSWSPGVLKDGPGNNEESVAALQTGLDMLESMEVGGDAVTGYQYDEKAVEGVVNFAEDAAEQAADDSVERERAAENLVEPLQEHPHRSPDGHIEETVREHGGDARDVRSRLPWTGEPEEFAEALPDALTIEEPDIANDVLGDLTGETYDLEDGHFASMAEEVKREAESLREATDED